MKRLLVILMCCLGWTLSSCNPSEAANEKFLGSYTGEVVVNGTISAPGLAIMGLPSSIPINDKAYEVTAEITPGSSSHSVNVDFSMQGQRFTTTATVRSNKITFDESTINYTDGSFVIAIESEITGRLNNGHLTFSGPVEGTGSIKMESSTATLNISMSGQLDGDLIMTKQQNQY